MPVASFHARLSVKRTDWFALPRTAMCIWKLDFPGHLYLGRPSGVPDGGDDLRHTRQVGGGRAALIHAEVRDPEEGRARVQPAAAARQVAPKRVDESGDGGAKVPRHEDRRRTHARRRRLLKPLAR